MEYLDDLGILLYGATILFALAIYFVKRRKPGRTILKINLGLLVIASVLTIGGNHYIYFGSTDPSSWKYYLRSFIYESVDTLLFSTGMLVFICTGFLISKRRSLASETPARREFKGWIPSEAVDPGPAFNLMRVSCIFLISCLCIAVIAFGKGVTEERYWHGPPIQLAEAWYGASVSYYCENMMITLDEDGSLYTRSGKVSLSQLDTVIANRTADKPRSIEDRINAEGQISKVEFIHDMVVHLRVNEHCRFEQVRELLRLLEKHKIQHGYFSVADY